MIKMARKSGADSTEEPKLTLQLTSNSFLDTAVLDAFSQRALYIIETKGRDTYLLTVTPDRKLQASAQVHWPQKKAMDGPSRIRVQMGSSRWRESEDFLKFGAVFT
jgi:hypothetical protein